jgi:branched-chain amino acid transport system substrate-binding protein
VWPVARAGAVTRTIYSSLPLVADVRAQAQDVVRGAELALQEAGGRVGDVQLRLVSLNDGTELAGRWDPGAVVRNAERAAADAETIAYIGEFNSAASALSIPILNEAGIAQVSPSNTYVGLTRHEGASDGEPGRYYPTGRRTYARVVPADHLQAAAVARYLQVIGVRRVFVVSDGGVYGAGLAAMVRRRLRAYGVAFGGQAPLRGGARDAATIARAVRRSHAGAMFYAGETESGAVGLWRAVHRANPAARLFGADGVADPYFARQIPRSAAARTYITNPTLDPKLYPLAAQDFFNTFKQKFGKDPQPYAIYGYEAMALILDCLRRAGPMAPERAAVVDQLFRTIDRHSVLGHYSIDAFGDTTLPEYGGFTVSPYGNLVFDRVLHTHS